MKWTRTGATVVAAVATLTLLLAVPLWELSLHSEAGYYRYYTTQAKELLSKVHEGISGYFTHEQEVYNNTLYNSDTAGDVAAQFNFSTPCDGFPNTDGIMLVMKTGATEAYSKMPTQLLTAMSCLNDFLLFSDIESQIGKYHFTDALDRVEDTIKKAHKEFQLYDAQQRCPISQEDCTSGLKGGWDLDKYKFLNMVERTWEKRPNYDWYVFAEADTYIVWSNLVQWLRERAPKGDVYAGSVAMLNGFAFAHGGSGYVISGSLMKKMVEDIPNIGAKYNEIAGHECCGDLVLSKAVNETGIRVLQRHPMFNGEKPYTIPYGNGQWCQPILSMHHVNPEEISMIWQYEQTRTNKSEIMQIKDLYHTFMAPYLTSIRRDWDNLSQDTCYLSPDPEAQEAADGREKSRQKPEDQKNPIQKDAHTSPAACAKVCESSGLYIPWHEYENLEGELDKHNFIRERYELHVANDKDGKWRRDRKCFQWRFHKGQCCTSSSIKFGATKRVANEDEKWTSGWFVPGIKDWVDAKGECEKVEWKDPPHTTPQPTPAS